MKRLLALGLISLLAACGGGGGGTTATTTTTSPTSPTAQLSALAQLNGTTDLTWSSTNASSCTISGSYSGTVGTSGTLNVTAPVNDNQSYSISCTGSNGTATAAATATPPTSFPTNCTMSTAVLQSYFWIGNASLGNSTSASAVASSTNPQYCISGSVAADGTVTMPSKWSFDYTNGIKTNEMLYYGLWPIWESAGQGARQTDSTLPKQLSALSSTFGTTYTDTINVSSGSAYDLLIDLNISSTPTESTQAEQVLELSINQECFPSCYTPNPLGTVYLNGTTYDVGFSPATATAMAHLLFNSNYGQQTSATVAVQPFINYAVTHGYILNTDYLAAIQVSHEIYMGSGSSNMTVKINQ